MNTDEVGGGGPTEVGDLRTEAGIGNIVAETMLLRDCGTEGTQLNPALTHLCALCG